MGVIILIGLVIGAIIILLTPALRAGGRKQRDATVHTAHEAVVSRLEDHRRKRQQGDAGPDA